MSSFSFLFRNYGKYFFFMKIGRKTFIKRKGIKVFDPMEDILAQIINSNVVLETIAAQSSYLKARKSIEERGH